MKYKLLPVFSVLWYTLAFAGVGYSSYYTGTDYNIELQYKVEKNVNAVIIGCMLRRSDPDEKNTTVQIPSKIGSCKVVRIEAGAFSGGTHWKSIKIPTSVTSIGNGAFRGCTRLKSITVPNSVETIGNSAFRECVGLESVNVGSSVKDADIEIGDYAFCDCTSLKTVTLHNGVMSMGTWAFSGCSSLSTISMPSSVVRIGERAFQCCENVSVHVADISAWCKVYQGFGAMPYAWDLYVDGVKVVDLVLPDGLISVGYEAFSYCESIKSLEVPSSVTSIEEDAFMLTGLKNVKFLSETSPAFGKNVFGGIKGMTVEVPAEKGWFDIYGANKWLGAVEVSWTDKHVNFIVENGVLKGYEGDLPAVLVLPDGITKIEKEMFKNASIEKVVIPAGVTSIGDYAFSNCGKLVSVTMTDDVRGIGEGAFSHCSGLTSISIPKYIWRISPYAFSDCSGLTSVTIPSGVRRIGGSAFRECRSLTTVDISEGVEIIELCAFEGCTELTSVSIPSTMTQIGTTAFSDCKKLRRVNINDIAKWCAITFDGWTANPLKIAGHIFRDGVEITDLMIPEGVTSIADWAFYGCVGLTSVTIPSGVTRIGVNAFSDCNKLRILTLSEGVQNIEHGAFGGCNELKSVTIPSGVTCMGDGAFSRCSGLESVTISGDVKSLGEGVFYMCTGLVSLSILDGVTCISDQMFYGCSRLPSVTIPPSVTSIGNIAFEGCSGLVSVTIPSSVTSIGNYAFDGCSGLTSVMISSSVTSIGKGVFCGCSGLISVVIPEGMTRFGENMFENCSGLKSVMIPSTVTSIDRYAFSGCSELSSMVLPEGVISIGYHSFSFSGIRSLVIPLSVTSIADWAFDDTGIDNVYVNKGDVERVRGLYDWPADVKFTEIMNPIVIGDEGATVTGDAETGFVIKPSEGKTAVEVTIPQGVDAAKVTVEVSPKIASVKPNGAKVKVAVGENDITGFLVIPESAGVLNIAAATVKEEIVMETLDPSKDAVIELNAANPQLITAPTRKGLTYTLFEGRKLESLSKGDSKLGDGDPWKPTITVSGGDAAFYSIDVSK